MKAAIFALLALAAPAGAMDEMEFRGLTEQWMEAQWTCRSGEDHDGQSVKWTDVQEACHEQVEIQTALTDAGYCYSGDMEWTACK